MFTLIFANLAGLEAITLGKALGTLLSLCGVVVVTLQDESSTSSGSFSGDALALVASACYGLYTVILRIQVLECLSGDCLNHFRCPTTRSPWTSCLATSD